MPATKTLLVSAEADVAAGEIEARSSVLCSHGREGFCHDDAFPEERDAVAYLHRAAFEYATLAHETAAEEFAGWVIARAWMPGVFVMPGSLTRELAEFRDAA